MSDVHTPVRTTTRSLARASTSRTPLTRSQKIAGIIAALRQKSGKMSFLGLYAVEYTEESKVRVMSTVGTALEPVREALIDMGVSTDHTVGGIMDSVPLSKNELHDLVCHCAGTEITGDTLANRFQALGVDNGI